MQPTVNRTVESLQLAGFNPLVFAEPDTWIDDRKAIGAIHPKRLGVWHNWIYAATCAYQSDEEYALIVQDDLDVHPDTRFTLEKLFATYPHQVISVYTPRAYSHENNTIAGPRLRPGLYPVQSKRLWGAVGFAWRRDVLGNVLQHPIIDLWRGAKPALRSEDIVNSDVAIGQILYGMRVPIWFPTPSFGIHTSKYSTIPGHGGNDVERNRNAEGPADFREPLWHQVFPSDGAVEAASQ
jgi:hypothetical protein